MNRIQLRSADLESGLLKLVDLEDGQVVAVDSEGIQYQIDEGEELTGDGFAPGGMLSSSF